MYPGIPWTASTKGAFRTRKTLSKYGFQSDGYVCNIDGAAPTFCNFEIPLHMALDPYREGGRACPFLSFLFLSSFFQAYPIKRIQKIRVGSQEARLTGPFLLM